MIDGDREGKKQLELIKDVRAERCARSAKYKYSVVRLSFYWLWLFVVITSVKYKDKYRSSHSEVFC